MEFCAYFSKIVLHEKLLNVALKLYHIMILLLWNCQKNVRILQFWAHCWIQCIKISQSVEIVTEINQEIDVWASLVGVAELIQSVLMLRANMSRFD